MISGRFAPGRRYSTAGSSTCGSWRAAHHGPFAARPERGLTASRRPRVSRSIAGRSRHRAAPTFTIVRVNGAIAPSAIAAVDGTFQDLPEGATFLVDGQRFRITYRGGDGNDVVLTAIDDAAADHLLPLGRRDRKFLRRGRADRQSARHGRAGHADVLEGERRTGHRDAHACRRGRAPPSASTAFPASKRPRPRCRCVPIAACRSLVERIDVLGRATSYAGHTGSAVDAAVDATGSSPKARRASSTRSCW